MKKVHYSITDSEMQEINPSIIPLAVCIRFKLNKAGFKFKDDGKLEAIVNLTPEPLGKFKSWYDAETMTTYYEQEYEEN